MNILTIENLNKSYGEKKLLDNVSLGINDGDKIGLIGINGTGKSTLLKIITGLETADSGKLTKNSNMRIEYLSQKPEFDDDATVLEQIFKGDTYEMSLLRKYEVALQKVSNGDSSYYNKLIKYQEEIESKKLWDFESEAKTILTKLGITDFNAKVGILSGGQKKRIALAFALIAPSDLLVLDEPTNHMDSESIEWLEQYLNNRKGALLMVTHDRYFLDRVTNRIIEVYNGQLYSYEGNYSVYVEKKMERQALEVAIQEKRKNLYRKELAWIKRGARARSTKQKARIERFEQLKDDMVVEQDENLQLSVVGSRLGKKIIEIDNVSKSFGDLVCIKDFTYILLKDDRIGVIGHNGVGKSTLMNIMTGKISPDKGKVEVGETVKIGYFSQENDYMNPTMRVIDYIKEIGEYLPLSNGDKITASQMLERFLFSSELQYSMIGKLSGGERRRLYLLKVLMGAPNVLLFDEPTNDLDIATLRILEDFLDTFNGPVITVSHDRYFLDRVCKKIFVYEGNGIINHYNGNFSDYLIINEKKKQLSKQLEEKPVKKNKTQRTEKPKQLKFTFKEKKEYEEIDSVIEKLENKIEELDKQIEENPTNFVKIQELLAEKEESNKLLEEKYDRWTYLSELAEKIEQEKKNNK